MQERKMPWLAGLLSIIPGAGQLYNGQYAKGIAVFTLLVIAIVLFVINMIGPDVFGSATLFWLDHDLRLQRFLTILIFVFIVVPLIIVYSIVDAVLSARRINQQFSYQTGVVNQGAINMNEMNQSMNEPNNPTNPNMGGGTPDPDFQNTSQTWSAPQGEKQFTQETPPRQSAAKPNKRGHLFWAIVFLGIGFMGMLQFLDVDLSVTWHRLWPLIPLALGLKLLADYHYQGETGQMILGAFFTVVGALFLLHNWGLNWPWEFFEEMWSGVWFLIERFWWLIMMVIGSVLLISYYQSKRT